MAALTIKCPECGGDKTIAAGTNKYVCQYCGATFVNESQKEETPTKPQIATTLCHFCGGEILLGSQKCRHCGEWLTRPMQSTAQPTYVQTGHQQYASSKSKVAAALLAFFLGHLGIHEFYLGRTGAGCVFLILFLLTFWMVWPMFIIWVICIIQAISYLCMSDQRFAEKYN